MNLYILNNGEQTGPYSLDVVNQMLADRRLDLEARGKAEGTDEWMEFGQIAGIELPARRTPPLPVHRKTPPPIKRRSESASPVEPRPILSMMLAQKFKFTRVRKIPLLISVSVILMLSIVLAVQLTQKRSRDRLIIQQQTQEAQLNQQEEKLRQERLVRENAEKRLEAQESETKRLQSQLQDEQKERDDAERKIANQNLESQSLQNKLENEREERSNVERELATQKHNREIERLEREKAQLAAQRESEAAKQAIVEPGETNKNPAVVAPPPGTDSPTVPAMFGERYPETRLQLLVPADLTNLNLVDLRYAINEMYARRGAIFKQAEIAKNFTSKGWYKPRPGVSFEDLEKEFSAIEADNLRLLGKERERKAASADLYELIDSESNLREGPGTDYPIVRKSRKGEIGEAISNKNGWMKLQFSDGSMAWAHEQNIKAAK